MYASSNYVCDQDNITVNKLQQIIQISTWYRSEVNHQIYYSESDCILFPQTEPAFGPGSLRIHPFLKVKGLVNSHAVDL